LSHTWRGIAVTLLIAGLTLVFFLPLLSQPNALLWPASGLGSDVAYINWPLQTYYADTLRAAGSYPLWDSRFMLGRPLAGDPHVLWGYPLNLLLLWLPTPLALNLFVVFHVFLAGLGMFSLLRRGFQVTHPAALLGALAFMFMPKFMSQVVGGVLAFGLAWVPWVWLGVRVAALERNAFAGALGGAALALLSPLHIQITYYAAVTSASYFIWLIVVAWRQARPRRWPGSALIAGAAFLITFGMLSAPIWLSLVELLPYTSRQGFTLREAGFFQLPAPVLITLFAPSQFQFPEWMTYLGVAPLALAAAAWLGPRRADTWFFILLAVFAAIYSLGTQTPLFEFVFRFLPGAGFLRVPTRLWAFAGAAVAVMAGLGVDALFTPAIPAFIARRRAWLKRLTLAYLAALAAALAAVSWMVGRFQGQLLVTLLTVLCLAGLTFTLARGRLSRPTLLLGLAFAILFDLKPLAASFFTLEQPRQSFLASSPALDFLAAQPQLFRVYSTHRDLNYAAAAERGVETLDGAVSFQLAHAVEIIKAATGCELEGFATGVPPCLTSEIDPEAYRTARPNAALLGLLNVKYVISAFELSEPGLRLVKLADHLLIYENDAWLPRAFVVETIDVAPDPATALTRVRVGRPDQVAYLLTGAGQSRAAGGSPAFRPAQILARGPGHYRLAALGPGVLVFSETWVPGWQARVDGAPVPVHRADYAVLGVNLPSGEHVVELTYSPRGWRVGWPAMTASAVGLAAWVVWRLFRVNHRPRWRLQRSAPPDL
jgi:hypothetical protein